jgi:hypothetical protein
MLTGAAPSASAQSGEMSSALRASAIRERDELLAYGTSAPIRRITSFSAKFTDAPLAEGKFETYLHERENAKKPRAVRPPICLVYMDLYYLRLIWLFQTLPPLSYYITHRPNGIPRRS